jgi:signal transduction histidine kinase
MDSSAICGTEEPQFLVFDFTTPPPLLFYAYVPTILIALILGVTILKTQKSLLSKLFFAITLSFSLWIINILVQWVASYHVVLMYAWQLTVLFELPIFILSLYFMYVFVRKGEDISLRLKLLFSSLFSIAILLIPTRFNVTLYDLTNCQGVLGPLWYLIYGFEIVSILWIAYLGVDAYLKNKADHYFRRQLLIFTVGFVLLLGIFTSSNLFAEILQIYEINLIGPVGLVAFFGLVSYLIIKFKTFNVRMFSAQILVFSLWVVVLALVFVNNIKVIHMMIIITFGLLLIGGYALIKSISKEITQRQSLETLTGLLGKANEKLKSLDKLKTEFLSLASHQLRSPLTAIKGYTSMLSEGSFGAVTGEQKVAIDRVYESTEHLRKVVEDLLDVSKIEQGGMKFDMKEFNLSASVHDVIDTLAVTISDKGLEIIENIPTEPILVVGDSEKLRQVFINLVDNCLKYTQNGSITIGLEKKSDAVRFYVKDTGMGIAPEIMEELFQKFSRGIGGTVNTGGSGLGLYLAKEIVEAHKGKVWAESEGVGKGSTFIAELPLISR